LWSESVGGDGHCHAMSQSIDPLRQHGRSTRAWPRTQRPTTRFHSQIYSLCRARISSLAALHVTKYTRAFEGVGRNREAEAAARHHLHKAMADHMPLTQTLAHLSAI
jgi:hypothetical protein